MTEPSLKDYRSILEIVNRLYRSPNRSSLFQELWEPLRNAFRIYSGVWIPDDQLNRQFHVGGYQVFNQPSLKRYGKQDTASPILAPSQKTTGGSMTRIWQKRMVPIQAVAKYLLFPAQGRITRLLAFSFFLACFLESHASGASSISGWTPRWGASAVLLKGEKLLVTGGFNGKDLGTTELLDLSTLSWHSLAPDPHPRTSSNVATLADGRLLVIGGYDGRYLDTIERFDPEQNRWEQLKGAPLPRAGAVLVPLRNGHLFISGGFNASGYLSSTNEFDPVSGTWKKLAADPVTRWSAAGAPLPSGEIFVTGGYNGKNLGRTEIYTPQTDKWRTVSPDPEPRWGAVAVTLSSRKILVVGGYRDDYLRTAEIYDPKHDLWKKVSSDPIPRERATGILLPDGNVLLLGGLNAGGFPENGELYISQKNQWKLLVLRKTHQ
ncbi:MAG: Kelch repeat-containing protein [Leptospirales bacterium]